MKRYYNNDNMDHDPSRPMLPIREMAMNNPFINNNHVGNHIKDIDRQRMQNDFYSTI